MSKPRVVIVAGPNGAGKSTIAKYLLPEGAEVLEFVNADQIALGLSAFAPETVAIEAGRVMLRRIEVLMDAKQSFAFETALASKTFTRLCKRAALAGYDIELVYVSLPNPKVAVQRVASRVRDGGHSIPTEVIKRRFQRSLHNFFNLYCGIVTRWWLFDNGHAATPTLIARGVHGRDKRGQPQVFKEAAWQKLLALSQSASS